MPRLNPFAKTSVSLNRLWQADLGDHVAALAWSPDGLLLAAASISGPIHVYDTVTGSLRNTLKGHGFGTTAIGFSAFGKHFGSTGQAGGVRLWELAAGEVLQMVDVGWTG